MVVIHQEQFDFHNSTQTSCGGFAGLMQHSSITLPNKRSSVHGVLGYYA